MQQITENTRITKDRVKTRYVEFGDHPPAILPTVSCFSNGKTRIQFNDIRVLEYIQHHRLQRAFQATIYNTVVFIDNNVFEIEGHVSQTVIFRILCLELEKKWKEGEGNVERFCFCKIC